MAIFVSTQTNRMKKIYFPVFIFAFFFFAELNAQVVINEVMITPLPDTCTVSMLDSSTLCGVQWVELYNPNPCQSVFLNYYSIGANTDPVNNFGTFTFWVGVSVIPPLGYLVIGANDAPYVDININLASPLEVCGSDPWSLNNGEGWIALYDAIGNVIDAVYWTALPGNPANLLINPEFANACCEPIVCPAPSLPAANTMLPGSEILYGGGVPTTGFSLARQQDGSSTWINNAIPTPGACNDTCVIPYVVAVTVINTVQPSCTDSTGSISVAASNGTPPYSYLWNTNPAQFTSTASNLPAGNYSVTATDSYGCTATLSTQLNPTGALTAIMNFTNVTCFGDADGTADVSNVLGGGGTYNYLWSNGATTPTITNLSPGIYTVTVSEAGGGTQTVYTENFDGALTWTLNVATGANDPDANIWEISDDEGGVAPNGCGVANNGDQTLYVTNTFAPGMGAAYNAGGVCVLLGICVITDRAAESPNISSVGFTNLTLDFDYIGNGDALIDNCSLEYSSDGGTIWNALDPSLKSPICGGGQGQWTAYSTALPAACENIANLKIRFVWVNNDDGAGTDPSFAVNNIVISSQTAGAACDFVGSVSITEPQPIFINTTSTPASCGASDGTATAIASGGNGGFNYVWNTLPAQNTSTAINLAGGNYSVTATDVNGCTISANVFVPTTGGPVIDTTNMIITDESCLQNDGSITGIVVTGGTSPYIIDWTYAGNSVGSSLDIFNLDSGTYTLTVTDSDSCPTTISVLVNPSVPLNAIGVTTNETCSQSNGSATVNVLNGTAPYTYAWSNGGNTQTITGLVAGVYVCTVTDANNCSQVITVTIGNTPAPVLTLSSTNISCFGMNDGTATAIANGGTAPITYLWSDGSTTSSINNLSAGNYDVTITDAGGCSATASANITEPAAISITAGPDQIINLGDQASITSSGSAGIVSYSWNPITDCPTCQNTTASPTQTTTYTVTGTDASGCIVSDDLIVTVVLVAGNVFVPDVFSPNGDFINDLLFVRGADIATIRMIIHDRWGNQLFETDNMTTGWDGTYKGKEMNPGVYVYYVYGTFNNGTAFQKKGDLTLIR